jgi:tol-pal system protein YbgF
MVIGGISCTKLPKIAMPRSARRIRRVTKASALAMAAITVGCLTLPAALSATSSLARAQESERPFGLFDKLFGGSERTRGEGERSAPAAVPDYSTQDRASQDRSGGQDRTAQMSGPDLVVRLDRLENQIRQLTGIIEQLQYRNQQLEAQIRRMQGMQGMQGMQEEGSPRLSSSPRPQSVPVPSSPVAAGTAGRRGDAFDPSQHPNAPGAPQTLGSVNSASQPPTVADAGGQQAGAPGGRPAGSPLDPPRSPNAGGMVATLPPSQSARDEFDLAYGYVLRRDYALAEDGFRTFLSKYPTDRLAGDATYWFGESLFQRQRFRDAAEAFLNVSTKYESNAKAPDALLRLGQSLAALGEKEAACASLGEVLRKFPRASAGVKQGVEREQKRVRC